MLEETQFDRTDRLFGEGASALLAQKRVAVFGVGGVGGYAVEDQAVRTRGDGEDCCKYRFFHGGNYTIFAFVCK